MPDVAGQFADFGQPFLPNSAGQFCRTWLANYAEFGRRILLNSAAQFLSTLAGQNLANFAKNHAGDSYRPNPNPV